MFEIFTLIPKQNIVGGPEEIISTSFLSIKSIYLNFVLKIINYQSIYWIKKKIMIFMFIKKYSFYNIQKTITITEIIKTTVLNFNLNHIKFINTFTAKKTFSKKNLFIQKQYFNHLKVLSYEKFIILQIQFYPISIQNLANKQKTNMYINEKNFNIYYKKTKEAILKKKNISIKKFYNVDLHEYTQSLGWFDSTGRRINTFSMVLEKVFYIYKKINLLILHKKLDQKILLQDLISILLNIETGKTDIFSLYLLKNYNEYSTVKSTILKFLKWTFLEDNSVWNERYSIKIEYGNFLGHNSFSSDKSIDKGAIKLRNNKVYNLYRNFRVNYKMNTLKYNYENFNIHFSIHRKNLLNKHNIKIILERSPLFKICQILLDSDIQFTIDCVVDMNIYKESFSKLNYKLHESIIFVLIWSFFENSNFISIALDVYFNVFQKSLKSFSEFFSNIIKTIKKSNCYDKTNCKLKKKIKNYIIKKDLGKKFSFSTNGIHFETKGIIKKIPQLEKQKYSLYLATETSSCQKLDWFGTLVITDTLILVKEYLNEKIKKLFKSRTKDFFSTVIKPYKFCALQSLMKDKNQTLLYFTVIDSIDNSNFKKITIKYDLKSISYLIIFICVKFKIKYLFFIFKNNLDEQLLISIKKQIIKTVESKSFLLSSQYFKMISRMVLDLINCMMIPVNKKVIFSKKKPNYLVTKKNSHVFKIIQAIHRGPIVYLWFLSEGHLSSNNLSDEESELFFFVKDPFILMFNLNLLYSFQNTKILIGKEKKEYKLLDKNFYEIGQQKIFYMLKKNYFIQYDIKEKFEKFSDSTLSCNFNVNNFYYKKIVDSLSNIRIYNFKIYKIFKKILCYKSILKWYYQLIYNIINTKNNISISSFSNSKYLSRSLERKRKPSVILLKISKILFSYLENRFTPKIIYSITNKKTKITLIENISNALKSWRATCLELNTFENVIFFDNFKKSRMNLIHGTFNSGFNFFIEKNFISNFVLNFNYIIFKKLIYIPAKMISIYPKLCQIKFSSLIDNKRFILLTSQSNYKFFGNNCISRPFEVLIRDYNFLFYYSQDLPSYTLKKPFDWVINLFIKNSYNISFIAEPKTLSFFFFRIELFFDKRHSKDIYKWRRKIFTCPEKLYQNLLKPFKKQFNLISIHKDFIGCGSILFEKFIERISQERKQTSNFFFTYVTDRFLIFNFVFKDKLGIALKGEFSYSSGTFFLNNNRYLNVDAIKTKIIKNTNII